MFFLLLTLAGLAIILRHDLANLARYLGSARLQAGDVMGAAAAFRHAVALGGDAAPLAYNLGVSLYRKGEYLRAREQFAAALATAGPNLRAATLYNRGNCQFRQAERLAAGDQEAARRFFQEAISDYGKALALAPDAVDAGGNLNLARVRLAALGADAGNPHTAGAEKPPQEKVGNGSKAGTKHAQPATKQAAAGAAQEAERADASATSGKTRRDLTRNEAERLLNEARGREKPAGMPHRGNRNGPLAKPDRDW